MATLPRSVQHAGTFAAITPNNNGKFAVYFRHVSCCSVKTPYIRLMPSVLRALRRGFPRRVVAQCRGCCWTGRIIVGGGNDPRFDRSRHIIILGWVLNNNNRSRIGILFFVRLATHDFGCMLVSTLPQPTIAGTKQ